MSRNPTRVSRDVVPFALVDVEGHISGLNRVGLRRAEVSREEVTEIRDVYRAVFAHGVSFEDGVNGLESDTDDTPRGRLVRFLRMDSKRGVVGRSRRNGVAAGSESERGVAGESTPT